MAEIKKVRTSKNGNEIYAIPVGTVEGVKTKFKSGNKGFRMFGRAYINGKQYQITGNVIELWGKKSEK